MRALIAATFLMIAGAGAAQAAFQLNVWYTPAARIEGQPPAGIAVLGAIDYPATQAICDAEGRALTRVSYGAKTFQIGFYDCIQILP